MIWLLIAFLCVQSAVSQFLPNERTSLYDCRERFFHIENFEIAAAAFATRADLEEFPHMAAIGWTDNDDTIQWKCGGTLVWYNFVLTAAHCVLDSRNKAPDVVRLGDINHNSSDDDKRAQKFQITEIIRHPEHTFKASYHDIALLKLNRNVVENKYVIPACLWSDEEVRFKKLVAAGWGRTGDGEDFSPTLLKVSLKPISNDECSKYYPTGRKLKQGLKAQHICAVDEKMDTCEGDSGGPLQINLMHNRRLTPFIVGITSFGTACGISLPGVYTRVSTYFKWIIDTMRQKGAIDLEENYNETFCAVRFITYQGYYNYKYDDSSDDQTGVSSVSLNTRINVAQTPETLAKIRWNSQGPECYGVIVDEDTVLTVADCATYRGKQPIFITYLNDKVMTISNVHIHPGYVQDYAYNNIAILKLNSLLDLPLHYHPSCISEYQHRGEAFIYGTGRNDMNVFINYNRKTEIDAIHNYRKIRIPVKKNASSCNFPQQFKPRLINGLTAEHLCVGNDVFLVPKSCQQLTGSMVGYGGDFFFNTVALSLFSRDCGFGEPLISVRLDSHMEWIKSILLPDVRDASTLHFVDTDLHEGDSCTLNSGLNGRCVPDFMCINQPGRSRGQVTFCSKTSVICCSIHNIDISSRIHPDIFNCPNHVKDQISFPTFHKALVKIGFISKNVPEFRCKGSIISRSSIVTTASCVKGFQPYVVEMVATKFQLKVDSVLIHPGFNLTDRTNDIALIKLTNPLSWDSTIKPLCLWTNQTHTPIVLDVNEYTESKQEYSKKFHPMYGTDCQRTHPYVIKDSQLCARSPYKSAICVAPGDQLVGSDQDIPYLVGLSTNACDFVEWKYSVFTRISAFLEWISDNAF